MSVQGTPKIRNLARNVSPAEGDLEKATVPDINKALSGTPFTLQSGRRSRRKHLLWRDSQIEICFC
jgi:hypothetical protein